MKYLSIMAGLMALSASPLLAQKTAAESSVLTPAPSVCGSTQACGNVDVPAPRATTLKQAKPSPELRSYVRLLVCNILTDISSNAVLLYWSPSGSEERQKYTKCCMMLAFNAYKATPQSGLMGDEKAFVEELNLLLPEFYASFMDSDMDDEEARNKMQTQILLPAVLLCQKYPTVVASFISDEPGVAASLRVAAANFIDIEKLQGNLIKLRQNYNEQNLNSKNRFNSERRTLNKIAKIAEMIRNNEI